MCRPIRANKSAALDGVIRFQHRRKISSILIRNTVVPIAICTTLGSCLAIGGARKPGVVMSIIPLDVQRRCERRWAARFSRPAESVAPRNQPPGSELESVQRSRASIRFPQWGSLQSGLNARSTCRFNARCMGDADARLCGYWVHGLSAEEQGYIDGRVIHVHQS